MRLVTYQSESGPRAAAFQGGQYVDLNRADSAIPPTLKELLAGGTELMNAVRRASDTGPRLTQENIQLLAPIPDPEKVICIGLNYADHARETGKEPPAEPVVFCKFPTAVQRDGGPIVLPASSHKVDFEAELVVVIGRGGHNIGRERALEHVGGYCCGHDVSARDWQTQKPGGQWLLGKSFDTFAPFGPHLVTPDEVGDVGNLRIQLRLNGQTMQDSRTSQLIFAVDELIAYISSVCTLKPGDLIFTGTPPGVGVARKPPVYLKSGDLVEVEIENVGILGNPVVRTG